MSNGRFSIKGIKEYTLKISIPFQYIGQLHQAVI